MHKDFLQNQQCSICRNNISLANFQLHEARCSNKFQEKKIQNSKISDKQDRNQVETSGVRYSQIFGQDDPYSKTSIRDDLPNSSSHINNSNINKSNIRESNIRIDNNFNQSHLRDSIIQKESEISETYSCPKCKLQVKIQRIQFHEGQCSANQIPCQYCALMFPPQLYDEHTKVCEVKISESSDIRSSSNNNNNNSNRNNNNNNNNRINNRPSNNLPSQSSRIVSTQTIRNGNNVTVQEKDAYGNVVNQYSYSDPIDDGRNRNRNTNNNIHNNNNNNIPNRNMPFPGFPFSNPNSNPANLFNQIFNNPFFQSNHIRNNISSNHRNVNESSDDEQMEEIFDSNVPRGNNRMPLNIPGSFLQFLSQVHNQDHSNNGGLNQQEVKDFSTFEYKKPVNKDEQNKPKEGQEDKCVICISEFQEGEKVQALDCFHKFHEGCIDEWLKKNTMCPVCKKDMREFVRN